MVEVGGKSTAGRNPGHGEDRCERTADHPEVRVGLADVVEQRGADQVCSIGGRGGHLSGGAERVMLVHGSLRGEQAGRVSLKHPGDEDLVARPGTTRPQGAEEASDEMGKVAKPHTAARNTQAIHELRNESESSKTNTRAMSTKKPKGATRA